jgi:hypothetical protein
MGVALIEVSGPQRGPGERVVGPIVEAPELARRRLLDHGFADGGARLAIPPIRGDEGKAGAAAPRVQPVSALLAQRNGLDRGPFRGVPATGIQLVEGDH